VKELYSSNGWELGIYDIKNLYVSRTCIIQDGKRKGEKTHKDMTYHQTIDKAAQRLSEAIGRQDAVSLRDYVDRVVSTLQSIREAIGTTECQCAATSS